MFINEEKQPLETQGNHSLIESPFLDWFNREAKIILLQPRFCQIDTTLNILATLVGFSIPIPYIKPAIDFAGDDYTLGILYGISEESAIGFLCTLLFQEVFQYTRRVLKEKRSANSRVLIFTLILPATFGFFTAIPGALMASIYNKNVVPLIILAFSGEFFGNTFSLQKCSRIFYFRHQLDLKYKGLIDTIKLMLNLAVSDIATWNNQKIEAFLTKHSLISGNENYILSEQSVNNFFFELIKIGSEVEKGIQLKNHSKIKNLSYLISVIAPLGWLATSAKLTFTHLNEISHLTVLSVFVTFFATIPIYLLDAILLKSLFDTIFQIIQSIRYRLPMKSITFNRYPYYFIILQGIFLLSGIFTSTGRAEVARDEFNVDWSQVIVPWLIIGNTSVKLYAISVMVTRMLDGIIMHRKDLIAKQARLLHLIHLFTSRLEECLPNELDRLIQSCEELQPSIQNDEIKESDTESEKSLLSRIKGCCGLSCYGLFGKFLGSHEKLSPIPRESENSIDHILN